MKSILVLLTVTVVVLGAVVVYDQQRISGLEARLAAQLAKADRNPIIGPAPHSESRKESSPERSDGAAGAEAADEEESSDYAAIRAAERRENPLGGLAELMANPAMREFFRHDAKGRIMARWSSFIDALGLEGEDKQLLYDILIEREVFAIDKVGAIMDEELPGEEREAAGVDLATVWYGSERKIEELLGDDGFDNFKLYEKSEPERMELSAFREDLATQGAELSIEQEEALMTVMFRERQEFGFGDDYLDEDKFFEVDWTNESFDRFRGEFEQLHQRVSGQAASILTPDQLRVFNENQANFRDSFIELKQMEMRALSSGGE